MTHILKSTRRSAAIAGLTLAALGTLGFAGAAQARSDVSFSVGVGLPGVAVGVSNAYPVYSQPVYQQPVYAQPVYQQQPVYVQQAPVYVQPRPVYVQPRPVYVVPQPVYYGRPHGYRHGGYRAYGPGPVVYAPGYGPRPGYGPPGRPVYVGR